MWFGRGFLFAGLMLLGWVAIVVGVAALATWWVPRRSRPARDDGELPGDHGDDGPPCRGRPASRPVGLVCPVVTSDRQAVERGTPTQRSTP